MKKRLLILTMIALLVSAAFVIGNLGVREAKEETGPQRVTESEAEGIYGEEKLFEQSGNGYLYKGLNYDEINGRTEKEFMSIRAYDGAPPTIPHPLDTEYGIGGNSCLKCHEKGGYVVKFKAFAPVTPHKEMLNCRQCHVAVKTKKEFVGSLWEKVPPPKLHQAALQGSPPMIPHSLQMRENCMACHGGPGAREDIRVSHPERANCRQCHVPNEAVIKQLEPEWSRQGTLLKQLEPEWTRPGLKQDKNESDD